MPAEDDLAEESWEKRFQYRAEARIQRYLDDEEQSKVLKKQMLRERNEDPSIRRRWTDGVSNDSTDLDVRHLK